ncbi:TPA: transposase, partial [Klebsiella pneumoniae]
FSSGAGRTSDGNGSHASTLKSPSYTKSVSWQHYRFNGRFRDECLNEHWFSDIVHARKIINDWRLDYNECRPHSSLNYLTPAEFAAGWRNGKYEEKPTDITN